MENRRIRNFECTSIGKYSGKNDDSTYVGENFAAVIDGVSHKCTIEVDGKKINVAEIITEAIRKIDRPSAPDYAKKLTFEEFVTYINMYIRKYCERIGFPIQTEPLEATGVIYSKYSNQIWLVGDCRAVYDGHVIENELKVDKVYMDIRTEITRTLLRLGYTEKQLFSKEIAKEIIAEPEKLAQYIQDENEVERIRAYIQGAMHKTLLECGFTEEEITSQNLMQKYSEPKRLQQYLKNNPNAGEYGYAVFNVINTELRNCILTTLPDGVKNIRLFSDGFPVQTLNNDKDLGYAIRKNRALAEKDPLSINENLSVRNATRQRNTSNFLATDDSSAVSIMIEYVKERDDEK